MIRRSGPVRRGGSRMSADLIPRTHAHARHSTPSHKCDDSGPGCGGSAAKACGETDDDKPERGEPEKADPYIGLLGWSVPPCDLCDGDEAGHRSDHAPHKERRVRAAAARCNSPDREHSARGKRDSSGSDASLLSHPHQPRHALSVLSEMPLPPYDPTRTRGLPTPSDGVSAVGPARVSDLCQNRLTIVGASRRIRQLRVA
jgi:hypothetical protein